MSKSFINRFISIVLLLFVVIISSCQKEQGVKAIDKAKLALDTDSANTLAINSAPGNFLALKGMLKVTIGDSTYTFDATQDSIAFVNVHLANDQYYGITAINKAHTMSFGISSLGVAAPGINSIIAGSQFLFKMDDKPDLQYTLTRFAGQQDFGKIKLLQYDQQDVLAKGTFFTFLAKDARSTSPFYRVSGSFDLQLK